MSTPVPPSENQPSPQRPVLGTPLFPETPDAAEASDPLHASAAEKRPGRIRRSWKPLLVGAGIGAFVIAAAAGGTGYVLHQNSVKDQEAAAKKFAAEKSSAVEEAHDQGFDEGESQGRADGLRQARSEAEAEKAEAQKPYEEAKTTLALTEAVCASKKKEKTGVTFTDHSVTLKSAGSTGGASMEVLGCILGGIDTDQATIDKINQTRALDGRQQDTWGVWEASWGYHPDSGLNLVIEVQDVPAG